jgi:hypothetical protein
VVLEPDECAPAVNWKTSQVFQADFGMTVGHLTQSWALQPGWASGRIRGLRDHRLVGASRDNPRRAQLAVPSAPPKARTVSEQPRARALGTRPQPKDACMLPEERWTVSVTFGGDEAEEIARDFARSIYDLTLIDADVYLGQPKILPARLEQLEIDLP